MYTHNLIQKVFVDLGKELEWQQSSVLKKNLLSLRWHQMKILKLMLVLHICPLYNIRIKSKPKRCGKLAAGLTGWDLGCKHVSEGRVRL